MKNIRVFYLKIFSFLEVKFSLYSNRHVFCNGITHVTYMCDVRNKNSASGFIQ